MGQKLVQTWSRGSGIIGFWTYMDSFGFTSVRRPYRDHMVVANTGPGLTHDDAQKTEGKLGFKTCMFCGKPYFSKERYVFQGKLYCSRVKVYSLFDFL